MSQQLYRILLYYKYVPLEDPEAFAESHRQLCTDIGLKGRIIVASEGINGTVSGTIEQTDAYMDTMKADPRFADMEYKVDAYHQHAFKKLIVRVKAEIVLLKLEEDISPSELTGQRLSPIEFMEQMQDDDVVIIDGRNDYEYDIGHFRNAIRPDVKTFREFPEWIRQQRDQWAGKKILTYCTGGIRCEKLSGLFIREGFEDVFQLHGGIVTYGKDPEVQGKYFDGKCYVFDERIAVPVNQVEDVVVGRCHHCGSPTDTYINCAYPQCHNQHLVCMPCRESHGEYCSTGCQEIHQGVTQAK